MTKNKEVNKAMLTRQNQDAFKRYCQTGDKKALEAMTLTGTKLADISDKENGICVKRVGEYIKPIMTVTTPIRNFENSDPFKRSLNCWLKSIK